MYRQSVAKIVQKDTLLLADLAGATGGVAMQISGRTELWNVLTPEQVKATLEKIAAGFDKVSSGLTPLQRFLKWSVSEWRSRTISSFSRLTVTESLENRINEGTRDGLLAAIQVDSANARLAAHFGRSLARYALNRIFRAIKQEIDPAEAQRALAETDFQTRRALKLAPDDEELKKLRAEVVRPLKLPG